MGDGDLFLYDLASALQNELYVHRITVAQRYGRLQPFEQDLPLAPERVRPHLKLAKISHQGYLTSLTPMIDLTKELEAGRSIAQRAGEIAMRYFRTGIAFEAKSDDSPVTRADRECEQFIASELQ